MAIQQLSTRELRARLLLEQGTSKSDDSQNWEHPSSNGVYNAESIKVLYPIDPRSGFPASDVSRLVDPSLSPAEKERVMSNLQRLDPAYMPQGLSDEDMFALLPPRYIGYDPVTASDWRKYLSDELLPSFDSAERQRIASLINNKGELSPEVIDPNKNNNE